MQLNKPLLLLAVFTMLAFTSQQSSAAEPGWTNRMLKVGDDRQATNATDIIHRPYRPGHFYGNTVRRNHYRGKARPSLGDVSTTVRVLVLRRDAPQ